jgi:D-glycero-alpha-D-manno-heptose-7-phosphate kinase
MIISRTPVRVSFVGGGTDISSFYRTYGGAVVSASIRKYFYLSMHRSFQGGGSLLKYSKTERVFDINDIDHRIIREVFRTWGIHGVDFSSAADIPSGTGLGSSSAFTSGLITLCAAYTGRYLSQHEIAAEACRIEIDCLQEPIGKQDQFGCAVGGLKFIEFLPDDEVVVTPLHLTPELKRRLEDALVLVYVGGNRSASQVLRQQASAVAEDRSLENVLQTMADQARTLRFEIQENPDVLGEYLHEGWERKKRLSTSVSSSVIDDVYAKARAAGAVGGKLLGAGGAGFLLLYVPPERSDALLAALPHHRFHNFKIDEAGSIIIYDDGSHRAGER